MCSILRVCDRSLLSVMRLFLLDLLLLLLVLPAICKSALLQLMICANVVLHLRDWL